MIAAMIDNLSKNNEAFVYDITYIGSRNKKWKRGTAI
jgi:hypothetical protein